MRGTIALLSVEDAAVRIFTSLVAVACTLLLASLPQTVHAEITLSQDFDSGSLNVAGSTISGNVVSLEPRRFASNEWYGDFWQVYFRANGVRDQSVTFKIPISNAFQPYDLGQQLVYSYDQINWSFAPGLTYPGSGESLQFTKRFTQDTVYIADALPYTVARTASHTTALQTNPYVHATASGSAGFVIGQSAGGTDDLGRTIPRQDIYGYVISDDSSTQPKKKVVLTAGNHSAETTGNYTLEGMVNFLLSDDPHAAALRQEAEFYVYPMTDPDGRYAGYYRSNPENPTLNHNRYWNDTDGFTDLTLVTQAMKADTGGDVDYFFDFHSSGWPWSNGIWYSGQLGGPTQDYIDAMLELEPTLMLGTVDSPGVAAVWAGSAQGLNADIFLTPETGFLNGWQASNYHALGESYALALWQVIPEPTSLLLLACGAISFVRRRR